MKRMVDTNIWVDARVEGLGSMAKLLWLYILTSPQGNLAGCFELTVRRIEVDTGIKAAQAQRVLDELCAAGLICCSADTGEVLIARWRKHNWSGGSSKLAKPLAHAIQEVKDSRFRAYLAEVYYQTYGEPIIGFEETAGKYPIDTLLEGCRYPSIPISITAPISKGVGGMGEGGPKPKPTKNKHGEFGNVLLTDDELAKLQERFPSDWQRRIDDLDIYIGKTGKSYKSHYLTVISWARDDARKNNPKTYEEVGRERYGEYNRAAL